MSTSALASSTASWRDYLELTKPRITLMVLWTTFVGFAMASSTRLDVARLLLSLLGVALVAAGASALNMFLEAGTDLLMVRTRPRPIPSGRLQPREALIFGLLLTAPGLLLLATRIGPLPAAFALLTWATYLFWYTPLKTRTSLAVFVGAVPGALPPVIGWASAHGTLEPGAAVLFAILFLWQIPHFLAIASLYRDDYAKGGLPMLPVLDRGGAITARQSILHSLCLFWASLLPSLLGMAGRIYLVGASVLGVAFAATAFWAGVKGTQPAQRRLFLASVLYLGVLSALLLVDRR